MSTTQTTQNSLETVLITGNTYPVKEQIKALGGVWDKYNKGWRVPANVAEKARYIVANALPDKKYRERHISRNNSRYVSNVYQFNSGEVVYRNKGGICIDAPCCGCCTI
jgi:hypothetical protein